MLKLPPTDINVTQTFDATRKFYQHRIEALSQPGKPLQQQTLATFQECEREIAEYAEAMEVLNLRTSGKSASESDIDELRKVLDDAPQRWSHFHKSLPDGYQEAFGEFNGTVRRLARLSDGRVVYAVGHEARIIDLKTGKSEGVVSTPDSILCLAAHPSKHIAYIGTGGHYDPSISNFVNVDPVKLIRVDLESGERSILHTAPKGRIREIALSPDGNEIICSGEGGCTGIHLDLRSDDVRPLAATSGNATMAGFRESGRVDAFRFNGILKTIDIASGEVIRERQTRLDRNVLSFVLLQEGTLGAAIDQLGTFLIFDMESGDVVREEKLKIIYEARITVAPDGHSVYIPSHEGVVWQVDLDPELPARRMPIPSGLTLHVLPLEPEGLLLVGQSGKFVLAKPEGSSSR